MKELDEAIEPQVKAFKEGMNKGQKLALELLLGYIGDCNTPHQIKGYIHTLLERLESEGE